MYFAIGCLTQKLSGQVVFADLPAGAYAVSVFHDENMNEKLDKNFVGVRGIRFTPENRHGII